MTMCGNVSTLDSRWSSGLGKTFGQGVKYGCGDAGNSTGTIWFQRLQGGKGKCMTFCQLGCTLNLGWMKNGGLDVRRISRVSSVCASLSSPAHANGVASTVNELFSISLKYKMKVPSSFGLLCHPQLPSMFSSDHFGPVQSSRPVLALKCARDANVNTSEETLVGEDSATFELGEQKISSWIYFSVVLGVVLLVLNLVWIDNSTGFGKAFIDAISSLTDSPEATMLSLILIFAIVHSGLASLRDDGEKLIGERAFRVLFAGVSLPLSVSTVVYFINHRYDGIQLWDLQNATALHHFLWLSNFISFLFLYPSTFNLLEVAAVDKPKMHLWETGIIRITRHPQMVGQVMWCLAHTIWIGNSVAVAASIGLIGHHLFGVWNGDRRLAKRYGEAFEVVKRRTSVIPFAAILDGRQKLPQDYYKEFLRLPYLSITALTLGAYMAHPLMQAASARLHW